MMKHVQTEIGFANNNNNNIKIMTIMSSPLIKKHTKIVHLSSIRC